MFTLTQIEMAHSKVMSGADFPKYIQEIKKLGVLYFETWVIDSHTVYFGINNFELASSPQYQSFIVSSRCDPEQFKYYLLLHQQGQTDYITFCKHCAETGIEKWVMNLEVMNCTYYDSKGNEVLGEDVPGVNL